MRRGTRRLQLQRFCRNKRAVGKNDGALNGILKFADIAGPAVIEDALFGLVGKPGTRFAELAREFLEEVLGEKQDVVGPLTKRRNRQLFFFNDTATTEIYTLSLHDALPISMASASAK